MRTTPLWRDPTLNIIRNPVANCRQKNSGRNAHSSGSSQARDVKALHSVSACNVSVRQSNLEEVTGFWQRVKEFISVGDLESAYVEALYSGDDLYLIELMDRTGPVLDRLSCETASAVLSILTTRFLDQRFLDSTISWLQQMEFLLALRELAAVGFSDPVDRISVTQLLANLSQVWGEAPCREVLPTRVQGN